MWEGWNMTTTPPEVPAYGGCLWPIDPSCAGGDEWDALPPDQQTRALALASATLQRLTGGRVGECPITVRPCKPASAWTQPHMLAAYAPFQPMVNSTGAWVNVGCCSSANCGCDYTCAIPLPRPVSRIDEVKVDGVVLAPTDYMLTGGNQLVWRGAGPCPFTTTQNLSLPDTEVGTYSVTYLNTYPVDSVGACAVGLLAAEYAKSIRGAKGCRLPNNVTAVTRQGVSMELVTGSFPDGLTGIREVDAFIMLWNPRGLVNGPKVWSPDSRRN